jgi:uncharacterized protein YodC (DUF2158 family)
MTFSQGDIVNVKSGGPALTVLSVAGEHVTCLFFSEELGEFKEAVIPSFALEAFDEDEGDEDEKHASHDEDEDEDDEDQNQAA